MAGKIGRDKDEIVSTFEVLKIIPSDSTISIAPDMSDIWGMHAQFARYGNVTLDPSTLHRYVLYTKGHPDPPSGYQKIPLESTQYDLYERK